MLDAAPAAVRDAYLWRAGDIGPLLWRWPIDDAATGRRRAHAAQRWWYALDQYGLVDGRTQTMARWSHLAEPPADWTPGDLAFAAWPAVDPIAVALDSIELDDAVYASLIDVVRSYLNDPALSDRLAEDFVDGAVYVGARGPIIAQLYARLGDPARALRWRERVVATSKRHADALHELATAAVSAGDPSRAEVYFIESAAADGDAGAANERAVRAFVAAGAAVEALPAGRRAVQLTAPGEGRSVFEAVAAAMLQHGRTGDAEVLLGELIAAVPAEFRDAARTQVATRWGVDPGEGPRWTGRRDQLLDQAVSADDMEAHTMDAGLAVRYAAAETDSERAAAVLERAIAWNPGDVDARVALLARYEPGDARYGSLISELLLIAQTAPPQVADRAREQVLSATSAALDGSVR